MMDHKTERTAATMIDGPNARLAVLKQPGEGPGLMWLGGYASDMRGTKAEALAAHAADLGIACTRFDYAGHGESGGSFEDFHIATWAQDAAHILTTETTGPQILVASSMGAWIAGLLAREHGDRLAGMILLAPAPDFATELTPHQWPQATLDKLMTEGRIEIPSEYDDSVMVYTKALFTEGAKARVLDTPLSVPCPVRIITGTEDEVVPWAHAIRYAEHIDSPDVTCTLMKGGDHRLSSPSQIALLLSTVEELIA